MAEVRSGSGMKDALQEIEKLHFSTRFAPSPTGPLHLGHAYSALLAYDMARAAGGRFLLRIEDIDRTRSRPQWEARIFEDLSWLGMTWETPVMRQTDRLAVYEETLASLWEKGFLYPCTCTRRDILAAASAPQEGAEPQYGPDGPIYPGTCRDRARRAGPLPRATALRLDMQAALTALDSDSFSYAETGSDPGEHRFAARALISEIGDVVLSRRDFPGSYHLSVVLDDAAQDISHVVRGADLAEATRIHVLLQHLLHLPTPIYHHHRLIRDAAGRRLAKRDDARAIATYRAEGASPDDIRRLVGVPASPPSAS